LKDVSSSINWEKVCKTPATKVWKFSWRAARAPKMFTKTFYNLSDENLEWGKPVKEWIG